MYGWSVPNYTYLPNQYYLHPAPAWPRSSYSVYGKRHGKAGYGAYGTDEYGIPFLIPIGVGLTGWWMWSKRDIYTGAMVGAALGAAYGTSKDEGMYKWGLVGSMLGWAGMTVYSKWVK
jgi:hypothetical protein